MATDVAAIAVRGLWFKHTYPGSQPLPEREPPPDNRWQRGDVVDALYLADSEETAWALDFPRLRRHLIAGVARLRQGGVDATKQAAIPTGVPA